MGVTDGRGPHDLAISGASIQRNVTVHGGFFPHPNMPGQFGASPTAAPTWFLMADGGV